MAQTLRSSRDVILRADHWEEAVCDYESLTGFRMVHRGDTLVGFDTGAFVLYVEKGDGLKSGCPSARA